MREDPDVILVGELRDLETMSIAVTAAEMGILVMATLHTNGAAPTVDRLVNAFPADKQPHVRTMLSTSLRGVVSQQLIQKADKQGRVAALEILVNTPAVANLIRQGKMDQLENAMQSGAANGMKLMDTAIQALLDSRQIIRQRSLQKVHQQSQIRTVSRSFLGAARANSPRGLGRRRDRPCRSWHNFGMTQPRRILVTSALPYANGPLHLGHILEAIQTDIWVRFQKLRGHECYYVCADDTHGTPIMLKAQAEGVTPEQLIAQVHIEHQRDLDDMLIGMDNFGSTHSRGESGAVRSHVLACTGRPATSTGAACAKRTTKPPRCSCRIAT